MWDNYSSKGDKRFDASYRFKKKNKTGESKGTKERGTKELLMEIQHPTSKGKCLLKIADQTDHVYLLIVDF